MRLFSAIRPKPATPVLSPTLSGETYKVRFDPEKTDGPIVIEPAQPSPAIAQTQSGFKGLKEQFSQAKNRFFQHKVFAPVKFIGKSFLGVQTWFHRQSRAVQIAPMLASAALGLGRTVFVDYHLEQDYAEAAADVDQTVLADVRNRPVTVLTDKSINSLSWTEALDLIHAHPYDIGLIKNLIPKILGCAKTPEAFLTLSYILMETFERSEMMSPNQRFQYIALIRSIWNGGYSWSERPTPDRPNLPPDSKSFLHDFATQTVPVLQQATSRPTLNRDVALRQGGVENINIQSVPSEVSEIWKKFLQDTNTEQEALKKAMAHHQLWLHRDSQKFSPEIERVLAARFIIISEFFPNVDDWRTNLGSQLHAENYLNQIQRAYAAMEGYALKNNPTLWGAYAKYGKHDSEHWAVPTLSMIASFGFVNMSGFGYLYWPMAYEVGGSMGSASYTAEAKVRKMALLMYCMPAAGNLCDGEIMDLQD